MVALGQPHVALKAHPVPVATQPPPPLLDAPPVGRRMVVASGTRLRGEITANGAKNAATKMMASALMTREPVVLDNVPNIDAIRTQADLLRSIGALVEYDPAAKQMTIVAENLDTAQLSADLASRERATFVLVGPLLARLGEAEAPKPGGCNIGERPVDVAVRGFSKMGVEVLHLNGSYSARTTGLRGARIYLDYPSHTGTENLLMAAALTAGTSKIEIVGVHALHGTRTRVMPDRIEAGSFAIAAAATGGDVTVRKVIPEHLEPLIQKLDECGAEIFTRDDALLIRRSRPLTAVQVQAMHYPGFPTDLQAPFCALLTQAEGE